VPLCTAEAAAELPQLIDQHMQENELWFHFTATYQQKIQPPVSPSQERGTHITYLTSSYSFVLIIAL